MNAKGKKNDVGLWIDELHPFGDILEIGFGLGDTAAQIQTYAIKSHTIIESDPQTAEKAKLWGSNYRNVKVIQGSWQDVLSQLGAFDVIFFNDYPFESEMQIQRQLKPEDIGAISNDAKALLDELRGQISQLTMKFSDKELDDFYQQVGRFHLEDLTKFLSDLKENGNISNKQYADMMKKYHLQEKITIKSVNNTQQAEPERMLLFLEECIKNHMRKGSLFTSYLPYSRSKYQDTLFFDRIITNPELDYTENMIPIKTANGQSEEALLMVVKKSS